MAAIPRVTCYPPLGQVYFTVVIETVQKKSWEAQIWHSIDNSEWSAVNLHACSTEQAPLLISAQNCNCFRYVFTGEICFPLDGGYTKFTVRFRNDSHENWKWANEELHAEDGELIVLSQTKTLVEHGAPAEEDFEKYFQNLHPDIDIEPRRSEAPGAALWHLSGSVEQAQDGKSGLRSLVLGVPSSIKRFFALVRVWKAWLGPRQGKGKLDLTEDAVLCSFLRIDGLHVVLLAVSGIDNVLTVFGSGNNGEMVVKSQNDNAATVQFQILASVADNFEIAMSSVIYEARKLVRPYDIPAFVQEKGLEAQWLSTWCDGLTYCTWNSLGQDLTEEKIISAVEDLRVEGINIANLVIDDNWQTVDFENESQWERGWKQFEANPKAFQGGLVRAVSKIRQKNPNIQYIAVWHSLFGYWGGISPQGELAAKYKTREVPIKDPTSGLADSNRNSILAIDPEDIQRFYDDFYRFLSYAGIDGVKADSQYFLDLLTDPEDRRRFTTAYQDAWTLATLKKFGTRAISCMSLFPQAIFHSQLPTNKPTIPVRNSDDFFPDVDDSHPWHVFCNAHNTLLTRYLNVIPDWDMFQTSHSYASFHAAARCVSGGPISITDVPGQHDINLINQIIARTPRGTTVILRPSLVGRTLDMYHHISEGHILRVGTYTGRARTGNGIIGIFNISSSTSSCIFPISDFPGIHTTEGQYIVRSYRSGKVAEVMQPSDSRAVISATLEHKGWDIVTAYPVYSFEIKPEGNCSTSPTQVAVLGLLGKMTGAAAILSSDIRIESNGRLRFSISLKALGTLGIYISNLPEWDIAQNFMVMISDRAVPPQLVEKEGKVLSVDIETAWKEMDLQAGWSNEVRVEIFLH